MDRDTESRQLHTKWLAKNRQSMLCCKRRKDDSTESPARLLGSPETGINREMIHRNGREGKQDEPLLVLTLEEWEEYLWHVGFRGTVLELLLQALRPPLRLEELALQLLALFPGDHGAAARLLELRQFARMLGLAKHRAGAQVKQLRKRSSRRTLEVADQGKGTMREHFNCG